MTRMIRLVGALTLATALAACSNGPNDAAQLVKNLPKALFSKKTKPTPITSEQIGLVLAGTPRAVSMYTIEVRDSAQVLMLDIQRNGPYQSFGNAARQVIVMRDGMMTSSRGLGGDLMSSEEDALLAVVQSRRGGSATYVQRFLTPEDVTETLTYNCSVSVGSMTQAAIGEVNEPGQTMTALCSDATGNFTNTFVVGKSGAILSARQWMGKTLGYVQTQSLRR